MRRRVAGVVVASVLLAGGALPAPAALQEEGPGASVVRIPFGELPAVAVAAGDHVWVLDSRASAIAKVDPKTNEVVDEVDVSALFERRVSAWDLVALRGSLWLTVPSHNRIVELDAGTGEVLSVIRRPGHVSTLYAARGSLWFVGGRSGRIVLVRMNPRNGKDVARFRLGPTNTGVADLVAHRGSVWVVRGRARHVAGTGRNVTFYVSAQLWKIDPRKNDVTTKRPLGATYTRGPVNSVIGDVEAAPEGLWMSRVHEKRLLLVRPQTGRVLDVQPVAEFALPWELELLDGDLWVGELNRRRVARIDPETNEKTLIDTGAGVSQLEAGFGSVWAPLTGDGGGGEIVRLTPQ